MNDVLGRAAEGARGSNEVFDVVGVPSPPVGPLPATAALLGRSHEVPVSPVSSGLADAQNVPSSPDSSGSALVGPRAYQPPTAVPTQEGPLGIQFDFNDGCRLVLPDGDHTWRVRLSDIDTGNVLYETNFPAGRVNSAKRYYFRGRIEVWLREQEEKQGNLVFGHDYSAKDKDVLVQFPVGTIGDVVGWFPYAVKFKEQHGCRLTCAMGEKLIPLFRDTYPDITFVTHDEVKADRFYATYRIGLFFDDKDHVFQPCDFRHVGLHRTAGYILGVDPTEEPPLLALGDTGRPVDEPYACIAVQSTTQAKYWNNPDGWRSIVRFLKESGYRVICIDQKPAHGGGLVWNHIPNGAEDQTGDRPLQERARWLKHADLFVGLSSGLSWLAWAAGTPVVMISGFSHPLNEFNTPHRVINYHTCNSCWNDPQLRFDHKDFLWCPRHKDTPRQFECTRLITAEHVMTAIRSVPQFAKRENHFAKSSI